MRPPSHIPPGRIGEITLSKPIFPSFSFDFTIFCLYPVWILLISYINPAYPAYILLISSLNPAYPAYIRLTYYLNPAYPAYPAYILLHMLILMLQMPNLIAFLLLMPPLIADSAAFLLLTPPLIADSAASSLLIIYFCLCRLLLQLKLSFYCL